MYTNLTNILIVQDNINNSLRNGKFTELSKTDQYTLRQFNRKDSNQIIEIKLNLKSREHKRNVGYEHQTWQMCSHVPRMREEREWKKKHLKTKATNV